MKVTRKMIGAAHDIMLARGDFVLSANLIEAIYLAMRAMEPMADRETVDRDAMRYRILRDSELFCIDEMDSIGQWEPVGDLDAAIDALLKGEGK